MQAKVDFSVPWKIPRYRTINTAVYRFMDETCGNSFWYLFAFSDLFQQILVRFRLHFLLHCSVFLTVLIFVSLFTFSFVCIESIYTKSLFF